jgi:hypothetical protein
VFLWPQDYADFYSPLCASFCCFSPGTQQVKYVVRKYQALVFAVANPVENENSRKVCGSCRRETQIRLSFHIWELKMFQKHGIVKLHLCLALSHNLKRILGYNIAQRILIACLKTSKKASNKLQPQQFEKKNNSYSFSIHLWHYVARKKVQNQYD